MPFSTASTAARFPAVKMFPDLGTDGQCSTTRHQTHFEPSFIELNAIL